MLQILKLKSFSDDAPQQLRDYVTGRSSLFRKRVKCVVFGTVPHAAKSVKPTKNYGPLMESNTDEKGNLHTECQRELFARSYLEIVSESIINSTSSIRHAPSNAY